MNQELKEQARKEFDEVYDKSPAFNDIKAKHQLHSFIDSLIDKTVQNCRQNHRQNS